MAKSFIFEDLLDQKPFVCTKCVNIPLKMYPQWSQDYMKEFGKPFFYEEHDTFPCQIYIYDPKSNGNAGVMVS